MMDSGAYGPLIVEAADRGGLGVVVALLAPPRVLHANASAAAIFGVSEDELRNCHPFDFIVPEQRQLVEDRLRRRLSGDPLHSPALTIARPDGSLMTVECRIVELSIDGLAAAAIFLTAPAPIADVAADARYRDLVDAAPDGVTITRGGQFLYANQAALALAGCATFHELSQCSMADLLSPDDLQVFAERTIAMAREGVRFAPRDYVVRGRGDGRHKVVEVSSMIIDFEGAPAVFAFLREVTDARRAQAQLERTQRLASLGTLVAGMAHEVNNPLGYATLGVEQLQRFFQGGCRDADNGRIALASVAAGLDRIAAIVRELRNFARNDELIRVPLELSGVLASALRMTAPVIRSRATLDVELGSLPFVRTSPGRLEQVFVNVLINAAQSFEPDGASDNVVRIRVSQGHGEVTIAIQDNGRGIAAEHLPRVFDPFFTTKPAGEGTGLGLSICHAIVTQHGGRIDVSSVVDRGTTVSIVLRTEDDTSVQAADAREPAPTSSRRARVLVVDDEVALARLLCEILTPAHDVTIATSGSQAEVLLLRTDHQPFDVVFCDLTMPGLSGEALFERVCAKKPELRRRFAFMTGGLFTKHSLDRIGSSTAPRLEKPFSRAQAIAVIERILDASG